jgi:cob(I)alamin adenosyltransferase
LTNSGGNNTKEGMSEEMKIYTRTGDKGQTSLIGGTRVPKYDDRIEAYGTIDELNSFVGLIRDHENCDAESKKQLLIIQDKLFIIESHLAVDTQACIAKSIPILVESDVQMLENAMDMMSAQLEPLANFILPGGHTLVSFCHLARTVCRRAERVCLKVSEKYPVASPDLMYLNRLSDYFFILARYFIFSTGSTETKWNSQ